MEGAAAVATSATAVTGAGGGSGCGGGSVGAATTTIADTAAQLHLLLQFANMNASALGTPPTISTEGVADPLGILKCGYKRKHSSIDSAVSSTLMTPIEGLGTPVDEGSPCFWGVSNGLGGGLMSSTPSTPGGTSAAAAAAANRRNKTFSAEMSDLFVHEVIRRKETLVDNNTNREVDFNRQKKNAWQEVYEAIRSVYPSFVCTVEGMKTHWRYRKRRVRDAAPYMKRFREQGVGGEAIGERMNDADWAIYDILTSQQKGEKGDGESDLEEKYSVSPPALKFLKMEDKSGEDSNGGYPVSPASVAEDSNPHAALQHQLLSSSLLLGAAAVSASSIVPRATMSSVSTPPALAAAAAAAAGSNTTTLPHHPIALRPNGETAEDAEDRAAKRELIKQQTAFFASMNCLVTEVRASFPVLLTHFLSSTPLASPANTNSSSSSSNN